MRKLELGDLGLLSKAVDKLGIRENIVELFQVAPKTKTEQAVMQTKLMANIIMLILENYWRAEEEVLSLLSRLDGREVKELRKLGLGELKGLLSELKEDEELKSFFT